MNACPMRLWRRSRAALGWCLLTLTALQGGLHAALDRWPEIRDPEYGFKLARLRERLAESPKKPLTLLLGSSRSGVGINPRAFQTALAPEGGPAAFNFAMTGAGPIQHLMLLRELLAERIFPERLLIEMHPLFLNQQRGAMREEARIDVQRLGRLAMTVLCGYSEDPARLRRAWWRGRLVPWLACRNQLLDVCLPKWRLRPGQYAIYSRVGRWGWLPFPVTERGEKARRERIERAHCEYKEALPAFDVTSEPDRALRALLDLCAERRIGVTFYLMPEGSEFRSWYPPHARPQVRDYLTQLQGRYGFGLCDLTGAMPDASFADSHHLLPEAVDAFSARFAREALGPALENMPATANGRYVAARPPGEEIESRR